MIRAMVFTSLLLLTGCFAVSKPRVKVDNAPKAGEFPHELLDKVLQESVDDAGKVDYKGIQESREDLDLYVAYVGAYSPANAPELFPTKQDGLAYYINAYNALSITGVIDRPGLGSVADDLKNFFFFQKYVVGNDKINLRALENQVVRPTYQDPRVHFALNCQSEGCPVLPATIFDPKNLDAQLDDLTRQFVSNPDKVRMAEDGAAEISQIFEWYAEDFTAAGGAVAFINQYGGELPADAEVRFIPYDWTLIAQDGRGP